MNDSKDPLRFTHALIPHLAKPPLAAVQLTVELAVEGDGLQLDFSVEGDLAKLLIPERTKLGQADELWRHTCFEAFFAASNSTCYHEFNFAPDGRWAVYAFRDYRQREFAWLPQQKPHVSVESSQSVFRLHAHIPAILLPAGALLAGLASVIETRDGSLSYWALSHANPQPDFHARSSFALNLPERAC